MLELQFSDGGRSIGELAPLPGFSKESLEDAISQVFRVLSKMVSLQCESRMSSILLSVPELLDCYGSVQFAIEMALETASRDDRHWQLISGHHMDEKPPVQTATLIKPVAGSLSVREGKVGNIGKESETGLVTCLNTRDRERGSVANKASDEKGDKTKTSSVKKTQTARVQSDDLGIVEASTVKIKVARHLSKQNSVSREISREISSLFEYAAKNPGVTLRLDANQGWDYQQACEFVRCCEELPIEFIEEPCPSLEDNLKLLASGYPIALDETLQNPRYQPSQFEDQSNPWAACILKPTMLGGEIGCQPWINYCRTKKTRLIISSSFESPLGISYLAHLARRWAPHEVHGLDTLNAFSAQALLPYRADDISQHGVLQWTI